MNYYPHHIGDYLRDTAHLSLIEHGAYRRLLDVYYANEVPFESIDDACDLVIARTPLERKAVEKILYNKKFFTRDESGRFWNIRAEKEIERFKEKSDKAKASVVMRWEKQKSKNENTNAIRTYSERNTNAILEQQSDGNTPITITKTITKTRVERETPRATRFSLKTLPDDWEIFCKQERPEISPQQVFARFSDYWSAKAGKDGAKLDWLATWRNWVRNEKSNHANSKSNHAESSKLSDAEFEKIVSGRLFE